MTGEVWLCEVEETYRNESSAILEVSAGELEVGDRLVNLRGESVVVEDIRRRPVPEAVYNFSVAVLHTCFVGQGGIWVHNNSGAGCGVGGNAPNSGGRLSPSNYPNPDPPMAAPPVRYEPTTIDEVVRMRRG